MTFACIRDCSVCPFSCNRQLEVGSQSTRNIRSELPLGLSVSSEMNDVKSEFAEKVQKTDEKTSILSLFDEGNKMEEINEPAKNLPVLADVQYEIKESKKSGLFNWRKKK